MPFRCSSGREGVPALHEGGTPSFPTMCKTLVALSLLCQSPCVLTQEAPDANANTVLQRYFYEIQHLQADFIQLEFDGEGTFQQESTGRLYLSRPGRFRFDYLEPDELMIWADGERLSMFDRELEQVTVWQQAERLGESAAALLAGDASVLESYEVNLAESEDGLQWFDLAAASAEEGDIRLALRDNVPAIIEYSNELGGRVQLQLYRLDLNTEIDDKLFNPEIPPGVDIFEAVES